MSLNITPAELKKFGIYAILSFFMSLSMYLLYDNISGRKADIIYERSKREELQFLLLRQLSLEKKQEKLLDTIRK